MRQILLLLPLLLPLLPFLFLLLFFLLLQLLLLPLLLRHQWIHRRQWLLLKLAAAGSSQTACDVPQPRQCLLVYSAFS